MCHQQGLDEGKGRGGSRLSGKGVQSMRVQVASTKRASTCHDAGLSDVRRAEAVSTTAVANAGESSTLGADAMHATLPSKRASSPGRGRWDATPCGRVEGEGAVIAPAAADATDWARLVAPSTLPEKPPAQRSSPVQYLRQTDVGVLHAGESISWRRRAPAGPAPPHMTSPRVRHGRPGPGSPGGGALSSADSPGGGGSALSRAGGNSWWRSLGADESWRRDAAEAGGGWSVLFSARTGESTLWVGGSGWWYGGSSSVSSPEPASGDSPRPELRDLKRGLPVSWACRLGRVGDLSLPRVARFLTCRHAVACCL